MMPITLLDLELDDWLDPSLPSNTWMLSRDAWNLPSSTWTLGKSHSDFVPIEPMGPFEVFSVCSAVPGL